MMLKYLGKKSIQSSQNRNFKMKLKSQNSTRLQSYKFKVSIIFQSDWQENILYLSE